MVIKTSYLDKVAFFTSLGAELIRMEGKYPDFVFTLDIPFWLVWYERVIGLVSYGKFVAQRRRLKRRGRRMSGLPEHFTGSNAKKVGFRLGDLVHMKRDKRFSDKYKTKTP
jgi:hypothetical protein